MQLKNLNLRKKFLLLIAVFSFAATTLTASFADAMEKFTVVMFYTNWSAASREAMPFIQSNLAVYKKRVRFVSINIDDNTAPEQARAFGLSTPVRVPYVAVVGKGDKILFQSLYNKNTISQIDAILSAD